jgi:carbamoyl-phosphate synthase large subunit
VLPSSGNVFLSIASRHRDGISEMAQQLHDMGYKLLATSGTAQVLERAGIPVSKVKKLGEGNPNLIDYLKNDEVSLIINTPSGKGARTDEGRIRAAAVQSGVPCITTVAAARMAVEAMLVMRTKPMTVMSLQERFAT